MLRSTENADECKVWNVFSPDVILPHSKTYVLIGLKSISQQEVEESDSVIEISFHSWAPIVKNIYADEIYDMLMGNKKKKHKRLKYTSVFKSVSKE